MDDADAGMGLVHRRLAILDLSAAGHQPMVSASGRWVIAFNGEIYNHADLRQVLQASGTAPAWRGHSDTETLLAGFEAWGIEDTLRRCVGMFAIALWDRTERLLHLMRDRLGEKPLYYGWAGDALLFGSELKALRAHPSWRGEVDRDVLALFFRHNYIPAPYSIYKGVWKLPPGTWLTVSQDDVRRRELPAPKVYWSVLAAAARAREEPFAQGDAAALVELERIFGRGDCAAKYIGRAAWGVPLGWRGFFCRRGADAGAVVPPRAHLHHRLHGGWLQRGGIRQGGGPPLGHRAHRVVCELPKKRRRSFPACRQSTTSRSRILPRSPHFWSRSTRASTSR